MEKKVRITFHDIGKYNEFTHASISQTCWTRVYDDWMRYDKVIPIISYFENDPLNSRYGRPTHIGNLKPVKLEYPELVFEGELFTDDPLVLGKGLDFKIENELRMESFSFDFNDRFVITSMEITCMAPSPVPTYPSEIEDLTPRDVFDLESDDCGVPRCIECKVPFETFEHIVKYRGNYYHECCFLELAIGILQAESLQVDYEGKVKDPMEEEDDV